MSEIMVWITLGWMVFTVGVMVTESRGLVRAIRDEAWVGKIVNLAMLLLYFAVTGALLEGIIRIMRSLL